MAKSPETTSRSSSLFFTMAALMVVWCSPQLLWSATNSEPVPGKDALQECSPRAGLPNFFSRLQKSEPTRIAYLGGSITAQNGWRPKTLKLFQQLYPQAQISEINAAIGGTGSDLGVFRLQHDVLEHKPQLLFVEFAVNDAGAAPEQIHRCMEGIVRQTWRADPLIDICFVYTIAGNMLETLKSGKLPRSYIAMEDLGRHYGIPSINFGLEVARLEAEGKLVFKGEKPKTDSDRAALGDKILFSPDAVHPYPETGHSLYLEAVQRHLPELRRGTPGAHMLVTAYVSNNWEMAKMLPLARAKLSFGWHRLEPGTNQLARNFGQRLPELWQASVPDETLEFAFKGTAASIYDLLGPDCGQVVVSLDDRSPEIRPRFDSYCTYHRLATLSLGSQLEDRIHKIKITLHPGQPDKPKILSARGEKIDDPKRYEGRNWYAGSILVVGDILEE